MIDKNDIRNLRNQQAQAERSVDQPDPITIPGAAGANHFAGILLTVDHATGLGWVIRGTGTVGSLTPTGSQMRCYCGINTHLRENKEVLVVDVGADVDPRYWVSRNIQGIRYARPGNIDSAQTAPPFDTGTGGNVQ